MVTTPSDRALPLGVETTGVVSTENFVAVNIEVGGSPGLFALRVGRAHSSGLLHRCLLLCCWLIRASHHVWMTIMARVHSLNNDHIMQKKSFHEKIKIDVYAWFSSKRNDATFNKSK